MCEKMQTSSSSRPLTCDMLKLLSFFRSATVMSPVRLGQLAADFVFDALLLERDGRALGAIGELLLWLLGLRLLFRSRRGRGRGVGAGAAAAVSAGFASGFGGSSHAAVTAHSAAMLSTIKRAAGIGA